MLDKLDDVVTLCWFMQLNPARGRKQSRSLPPSLRWLPGRFMQLNPARGRKLNSDGTVTLTYKNGFMQLNPARGRKLEAYCQNRAEEYGYGLCSSTPRGDGNSQAPTASKLPKERFMQLNPARGRKRVRRRYEGGSHQEGLCSSTPRGDGNVADLLSSCDVSVRFMQLNPARGRKPAS